MSISASLLGRFDFNLGYAEPEAGEAIRHSPFDIHWPLKARVPGDDSSDALRRSAPRAREPIAATP